MVGGACFLFIGLIGVAGAIAAGVADPNLGFRIGFGPGFGCIWPLVWGALGFSILRNAFSKLQLKFLRVMGPVNIIKVERTDTIHARTHPYSVHELHIGGRSFDVPSDLADIMMQGLPTPCIIQKAVSAVSSPPN
ncbi:MAG TPA: hypothetical protein VLX61_03040 [Anaerolineales bacterium]|nr:hypothetical protein [Anaerolineales bacterium]